MDILAFNKEDFLNWAKWKIFEQILIKFRGFYIIKMNILLV